MSADAEVQSEVTLEQDDVEGAAEAAPSGGAGGSRVEELEAYQEDEQEDGMRR